MSSLEDGERVLARALELARAQWQQRLVAAYALGSLAHGGFSPAMSDVDAGFILADPLDGEDEEAVKRIAAGVRASALPLAERLSIFWGSPATLSGAARGGRFPPLDVLDLKQYGRLLAGRDVKSLVLAPTTAALVASTAGFALRILGTPEVTGWLGNPARLASADSKQLVKTVLYPVRFLYTARTGDVGMNDKAVAHFLATETGPATALVAKAFEWRFSPPPPGDPEAVDLLREGVLPLYRIFLDDYGARLRQQAELDLAQALQEWRQRLG